MCRSSCSIFHGTFVLRLYSDCMDCYGIGWIVWAEKTISLRVTVVSGPIPTTMNAFAPCLGALYPTFCFCQLFGTTSIGERWFQSTLLAWCYGFTIAQVVWFPHCYSALIAFDFPAEVGCHLNACLTSFVFPRPFDPRWIRIHLTSLKLSLFLFYIPRHVVCCDCNGIGWIATRLVWLYDRMILLRKFSVICLCPPIVSDPVGWRLKYTEVQSQWMAFTQSPSLSNSPKILNNYLIFLIFTVQWLWIFVVCSVIETTFIGERGFRFIRSGMPIGNGPLSISSTLA